MVGLTTVSFCFFFSLPQVTLNLSVEKFAPDRVRLFVIKTKDPNNNADKIFWLSGNNKGNGAVCRIYNLAIPPASLLDTQEMWEFGDDLPPDRCY